MQEKQSENNIHQSIFKWYHNTFCLSFHIQRSLIFSIPNQNHHRLAMVGIIKAGVSDLVVIHRVENKNARIIFVEVKTETGKQSPSQKQFEKHVQSMGLEYYVIRSLEKFKSIINGK